MDGFWEDNAESWIKVLENQSISSRTVTNAAIVHEITNRRLFSLLDVGCGEGWLAKVLPEDINYMGIDGSAKLIEHAKRESSRKFLQVSYDDIIQKKWTPSLKIAGAVFNFSLLDEDISDLLKNVSDYLEPHGVILIQTLHPCFGMPEYKDAWNREDFKAMTVPFKNTMPWYGRTLASWIEVFSKSDLYLDSLVEPTSGTTPSSILFSLKKRRSL